MELKMYFLKNIQFMKITVTVTEKEILETSNDFELGGLVRNKYWQERRNMEGPPVDDEHFFLNIGEDGLVKSIGRPWVCSVCGKDTSGVDNDYLAGWDHIACRVSEEITREDEFDTCVICGKETPYKRSTHIDMRVGYVEGSGQTCLECYNK